MNESQITESIKRALKREGWWVFKIQGGPRQVAGIPDLLCCKHGIAVWLEVKTPDGKLSKLQSARMQEIRLRGGCVAEVVTSVAEALQVVRSVSESQP